MSDLLDSNKWVVLIIEDDADNISVAEQVLEYHGATVYSAEDGLQGLEQLQRVKPSFILLDLSMPVMDGWETIKAVRQQDQFRELPIIAVTAHAMTGDAERAMEAGFDGYITKPFNIMRFMDEIMICLQMIEDKNKDGIG